jgi:hypothetical protein
VYVYGNSNDFNEGAHSTNIVNGSGNAIYAGDASNVTFNGNSNYASIGNYSNIWFYGSGNQGYDQYGSELFLQGTNNYASAGAASDLEVWMYPPGRTQTMVRSVPTACWSMNRPVGVPRWQDRPTPSRTSPRPGRCRFAQTGRAKTCLTATSAVDAGGQQQMMAIGRALRASRNFHCWTSRRLACRSCLWVRLSPRSRRCASPA